MNDDSYEKEDNDDVMMMKSRFVHKDLVLRFPRTVEWILFFFIGVLSVVLRDSIKTFERLK